MIDCIKIIVGISIVVLALKLWINNMRKKYEGDDCPECGAKMTYLKTNEVKEKEYACYNCGHRTNIKPQE